MEQPSLIELLLTVKARCGNEEVSDYGKQIITELFTMIQGEKPEDTKPHVTYQQLQP
jgi:hypothetical protein